MSNPETQTTVTIEIQRPDLQTRLQSLLSRLNWKYVIIGLVALWVLSAALDTMGAGETDREWMARFYHEYYAR